MTIANSLGYVTAVETLKVVTETSITKSLTGVLEEKKYKVVAPELMHEAFLSDSEDEGGDEHLDHHQYKYMATDDLKTSNDQDHHNYDTTITTDHDHVDNANYAIKEQNKGKRNKDWDNFSKQARNFSVPHIYVIVVIELGVVQLKEKNIFDWTKKNIAWSIENNTFPPDTSLDL